MAAVRLMALLFSGWLCGPLYAAAQWATYPPFHAPPGPFFPLTAADLAGLTGVSSTNRLLLTPYFYWYDIYSGLHLRDADGSDALTDHPATLTGFSFTSAAWHRTQMLDMIEAGIDVLLPVYWGEPSQRRPGVPVSQEEWSYAGLPPLVAARDGLLQQGLHPPAIGLFYDTSTLQFNAANERQDLTTPRGRQWFYESVRDFFSLVPPRHWALIDGRPVIFLYSAAFALRHDATVLEYLRESFARDFGGRTPYVVREISWQIAADDVYAWGGALGLKNPGLASLGPGYDHSAVPDRTPLVVPREDGAFFERNWLAFLRRPSRRVMIETWNEFHEGTDIANSREYGRQYITLNRRYADLFKAGYEPGVVAGPFTDTRLVETRLGATNLPAGLIQFDSADGLTRPATEAGLECRLTATNAYGPRYMYFRVDDSFKWAETMDLWLVAEIFDAARGTLRVEFDGSDESAPFQGAYSPSDPVALSGTRTWRTVSLRLNGARFRNGQNGGADLRLNVGDTTVGVRRVQLVRQGLRAVRFSPAGELELGVYGAPGYAYDLQFSDDLRNWAPAVRLRPATSEARYQILPGDLTAARWYRLLGPAP